MKHLVLVLVCLGWSSALSAQTTYTARVLTAAGAPVPHAVVSLQPVTPPTPPPAPPREPAVIVQINQDYQPYVTPVLVGTTVDFPNRDNVQHHLYSLSPAKRFEKPLYRSGASESVVFDKPGVVTLGCNIHDWMSAYVVVLSTPHFARTDENGRAVVSGLPPGAYQVEVWHPRQPKNLTRDITIADQPLDDKFSVTLRPLRGMRRAPGSEGTVY